MVTEAFIKVRDASFGYKAKQPLPGLSRLSFELFKGELTGVVGINGVGKSTILKTLCGLIPLLGGEIIIEGKKIKELAADDLARLMSIVLTERLSGFNLKVKDVVAMGQMPYTDAFHRIKEQHQKIIDVAIQRAGVKDYEERELSELSDGMFQKTVIAKALAQQTPCLLLDEPSAFLDYASKHALYGLLKQLANEEKKCVLVSSHDLDLLLRYCGKLMVLSEDGIEMISVKDAMNNKRFIELGGGFIK
jgi:iron complex transport system ATP-binding protein